MAYNPDIHKRRSIRLKGYDYSQANFYFITICCDNNICRFGNIVKNEMILNDYGKIAYNQWEKLAKRFQNFELNVFQIMPNHIHGIIVLNDIVGASLAVAQNGGMDIRAGASPAPTIADIVGAYKSLVSNECLEIFKSKNETMGKLWHRNYYEHIIRNEQSYENISNYITNNPVNWQHDKFNNIQKDYK
ncbi:MAG: hypothetical protein PHR06_04570 [Candidatus Cloacimonetes bacterium]|nr:hypothetical protein [Candidatus Cloacimonadota bacterium]